MVTHQSNIPYNIYYAISLQLIENISSACSLFLSASSFCGHSFIAQIITPHCLNQKFDQFIASCVSSVLAINDTRYWCSDKGIIALLVLSSNAIAKYWLQFVGVWPLWHNNWDCLSLLDTVTKVSYNRNFLIKLTSITLYRTAAIDEESDCRFTVIVCNISRTPDWVLRTYCRVYTSIS